MLWLIGENVAHQEPRESLFGKIPYEEMVRSCSNELQITPITPKAFVMVSADDDVVPMANTIRYVTDQVLRLRDLMN